MANKRFWLGIPAMALVFTMTVVGCKTGTTTDSGVDTYKSITSLKQLNGTWKGSLTSTEKGTDTYKMVIEATMTFTATSDTVGTMTDGHTSTLTFTCDEKQWADIKSRYEAKGNYKVKDENHSLTIETSITRKDYALSVVQDEGLKINQNGDRVKQPPHKDEGIPEMIYIKQK